MTDRRMTRCRRLHHVATICDGQVKECQGELVLAVDQVTIQLAVLHLGAHDDQSSVLVDLVPAIARDVCPIEDGSAGIADKVRCDDDVIPDTFLH